MLMPGQQTLTQMTVPERFALKTLPPRKASRQERAASSRQLRHDKKGKQPIHRRQSWQTTLTQCRGARAMRIPLHVYSHRRGKVLIPPRVRRQHSSNGSKKLQPRVVAAPRRDYEPTDEELHQRMFVLGIYTPVQRAMLFGDVPREREHEFVLRCLCSPCVVAWRMADPVQSVSK